MLDHNQFKPRTMKHNYLLIIAVLAFGLIASCKKDPAPKPDPDPGPGKTIIDDRPPEKVVEALTTELAKVEEVSDFAAALKTVVLTKEEVSEGLTIFAPLNTYKYAPQAMASRLSTGTMVASASQERFSNRLFAETSETVGLTDKELRDHIVKGVYKLADLADGTILTTLSGKSLKIKKEGDQTFINGIKINESSVSSDGKQTFFVVSEPLSATNVNDEPVPPASIEVVVWDAIEWDEENPLGKEATDAKVRIYRSQEDFAEGKVLDEGVTDSQGKVIFDNLKAGTYYVVASKGDMSSVFYPTKSPDGKLITGMVPEGIFQFRTQIENAPPQSESGKPGNFQWLDTNGDGRITNEDKVALPAQFKEVEANTGVSIFVTIGYNDNHMMGPIKRESQVREFLTDGYLNITEWLSKEAKLLDGVLSDDSEAPSSGYFNSLGLQAIDNFTFTPTNAAINRIWESSYISISTLNKLIRDVPNADIPNKNQFVAQFRALRAALYVQLMTYYGNVPILKDVQMDANISTSSKELVYGYIKQELAEIQKDIPKNLGAGTGQLNASFVSALLAKAAIVNKEYALAASSAADVINSGIYTLTDPRYISDLSSRETIWGYHFLMSNEFKTYFSTPNYPPPVIRLSEIYLIAAEANIQLGNREKAINYLNPILHNNGLPTLYGSENTDALNNTLRSTWKAAMPREGMRFANLVRWGIASEVLGNKGFNAPKHNLLPIPQVIIDRFPGITQNPGYQ